MYVIRRYVLQRGRQNYFVNSKYFSVTASYISLYYYYIHSLQWRRPV